MKGENFVLWVAEEKQPIPDTPEQRFQSVQSFCNELGLGAFLPRYEDEIDGVSLEQQSDWPGAPSRLNRIALVREWFYPRDTVKKGISRDRGRSRQQQDLVTLQPITGKECAAILLTAFA